MPGVDNFAHAGGFIGGYATSAFFNPLTRERGDTSLMAVVLPGRDLPRDRLFGSSRSWTDLIADCKSQSRSAIAISNAAYFFAASSSSITRLKFSNGCAPVSGRPLMKKAGVPFTPASLPACASLSTTD